MWGDQCNTCGGHENEIRFIAPCQHCSTKICNGCRPRHEAVCEEMTKRKKRGLGPTVIAHHNPPPTVPDIVATLPEVDVDAVNAELAIAEAEANEKALVEAQAALLASAPLLEAVAENPAVAALIDPFGLLQAGTVDGQPLESPLTVGDVVASAEENTENSSTTEN